MMKHSSRTRSIQVAMLTLASVLVASSGCDVPLTSTTADGTTNDNGSSAGDVTVSILSFSTSFPISELEDRVSVVYNVTGEPDSITGFRVPVSDVSTAATEIGDRVFFAENLPTGRGSFDFDPGDAGVGNFKVGVFVQVDENTTIEALTVGVIQVQGPPNPKFIQPVEQLTEVLQGAEVFVSFDVGDPEGNVQWRIFFRSSTDSCDAATQFLGTELGTGSTNVASAVFSTSSLPIDNYELGISATDSGFSVATTVANGDEDRIVTICDVTDGARIVRVVERQNPLPPTVAITVPGTGSIGLFRNEAFQIEFEAEVNEPGATGSLDVFYDLDRDFNNGFNLIQSDIPVSGAAAFTADFPTDLDENTYNIGAAIRDGINPVVFTYATGQVDVVRNVSLSVTGPDSDLPIAPIVAGQTPETAEVTWVTNAPDDTGTVDVFAQTVDTSGNVFGDIIPILTAAPMSTRSAEFSSVIPGRFQITVRLNIIDGTTGLGIAPKPVRVSSLPRILWLGSLADSNPAFEGAIFAGVNFEDNAGSAFTSVGDLNGDSAGEFVIAARYGKPFFVNPSGIGPGEAYLIYGQSGSSKLTGEFNLNSTGTDLLTGVTFTGIRTPQNSNDTDGMSSVLQIPDVDGDGRQELVFGFPDTDSRGHNVDPQQDGVIDPRALSTLEREEQFKRGGIVIVSSRNSVLADPNFGIPVINLDLVGQDFLETCAGPEPDGGPDEFGEAEFSNDILNGDNDDPNFCEGSCEEGATDNNPDSNNTIDFGFVRALARDYFSTNVYSFWLFGGLGSCDSADPFRDGPAGFPPCLPLEYCLSFPTGCEPFSPGLHEAVDPFELDPTTLLPVWTRRSGFYVDTVQFGDDTDFQFPNTPNEPFGARIIGIGIGDDFGTSVTLSNATGAGAGDIIVSSPNRTARGILMGPAGGPEGGGEIDGLESAGGGAKTNADAGVAYLFPLRSLWTNDNFGRIPPKPHQYIVGDASHCGGPSALIENVDALRIAGFASDKITNIVGIDDFNADGRDDFAIGAPDANGGQGRIYIGFRRQPSIEGDYVLEKLALDPLDPGRLAGVLIVTDSLDAMGSSLVSGLDFNNDGLSDLIIGSPKANNGAGEIIVVFGDPNLVSPIDGVDIETLLGTRNSQGLPRAARITGNVLDVGGGFGFNLANAGDIDGDGKDDLLIAAPNASPRFDPDPNDGEDALTTPGLDLDLDGVQDDVSGQLGLRDGVIDSNDNLDNSGIVYVISSQNRLDLINDSGLTINIDQLGTSALRGFMIVGRQAGDRIGGGDAGDDTAGGITQKSGRGRSAGLASAGDVDGDGRADILIGSVLADPRRDPNTGVGVQNGGEAYLIYGTAAP